MRREDGIASPAAAMATVQQDFIELNRIKNRCLEILPVTSAFAVLTLTTYLGLRLKTTLEAFQATNDSRSLLSSLLYLVVEAGFFLPNFLNHILRCLAQPPGTISHLRLSNDTDHPAVDIFITCCGEDVDTITNTVEAACALDYPTSCFRVIVLDDAASEELLKRIESIKKYRPNLFYTARSKDDHQDFKAGNLNHGFKYVETLAGGPAPFIAALDTDMIPDPKWLLALLPHLLRDDGEIALVQPPQVRTHHLFHQVHGEEIVCLLIRADRGSMMFHPQTLYFRGWKSITELPSLFERPWALHGAGALVTLFEGLL